MDKQEIRFLPYAQALGIVAAIQEEEDAHQPDHRILTVYNHANQEICWFDFAEVMAEVGAKGNRDEDRAKVTEYIMRHIPDWALEA